ncbi:hypothetical protein ACOME3_002090 [Neoechinorhynchus agilis]
MDIIRRTMALPNDIEATITCATSPFLLKALEVMQTKPLWQSYLHGHMISEDDYKFITVFESSNEEERKKLLESPEFQRQFAKTFLVLISTMSKEHTVQYAITLLDNSMREDKSRVNLLRQYTHNSNERLLEYFFNLLMRQDSFVVHQASRIIAKVACWSNQTLTSSDLSYYLSWLKNQLDSKLNPYIQTACRCLQMMLRIKEYQKPFVQSGGFSQMCSIINDESLSFQLQYQIIFCLYIYRQTEKNHCLDSKSLIPRLVSILFATKKEKVTRVVIMLFRNLLVKPTNETAIKDNGRAMLASHFLKNINIVEEREIDDDDVKEDIQFLKEKLEIGLEEITSFDEYYIELKSGYLSWSPVHRSENFWKDNVDRFNDEGFKMLRMLLRVIEADKDPLSTSVAIHDIGNYVRYYHRGRMIIDKLDGKKMITEMLHHEDPGVRYQALVCVQKLMLHNWDYLGIGPPNNGAFASPVKSGQ